MMLALLVVLQAAPPELDVVRSWLSGDHGPGRFGEAVLAAPVLAVGSPEYNEVASLLRPPRALVCPGPPGSGRPEGTLWSVDVDGDGVAERVFSGGCSPAPYFLVFRRAADTWARWLTGSGALFDVRTINRQPVLVSSRDGYGISREAELVLTPACSTPPCAATSWHAIGEQAPFTRADGVCRVTTTVKLRTGPVIDDAPVESGMGFDYPGNLVLTLAKGSLGLLVGTSKGWRLCAFPSVSTSPESRRELLTPSKRVVDEKTTSFILGWLPD